MTIAVYVVFIVIALALAVRYCFADAAAQYLTAVAFVACAAYMAYYMLRFVRFLKSWGETCLEIDGDRISGLSVDPKKGTGEPFEIGIREIEDVALQNIRLTRRGRLPVLTIRTSSEVYYVFGIEDMQTARSRLRPGSEVF